MKNLLPFTLLFLTLISTSCTSTKEETKISEEQLLRIPYTSATDNTEREYFVYLPKGYENETDKEWPILMFLHGNGERGNGNDELDYVMIHGPLYEAWVQKRDLPFIMIVPQLHMLGMDELGIDYIDNRTTAQIPQRIEVGVPERPISEESKQLLTGALPAEALPSSEFVLKYGWNNLEDDLLAMLDKTLEDYNADVNRVYLSGLSFGGFGTWHMASQHPERFAAINPIVGYGYPKLMEPIAKEKIPTWVFAGGRDTGVQAQYFYEGLNKLAELGHHDVLFTIHEDTGHVNTWRRIYEGEDIYTWFLSHSK